MNIDYTTAETILRIIFDRKGSQQENLGFPATGALSEYLNQQFASGTAHVLFGHEQLSWMASASVEMWHRAIHSFLLSLSLSKSSPMWSSISGYYSSHFVMRAFGYALGILKSFQAKQIVQVVPKNGGFTCNPIDATGELRNEHAFYWKAVKKHPMFLQNPLFRTNGERSQDSDSRHRTFANYIDHVNHFSSLSFIETRQLVTEVEKIRRIKRNSIEKVSRNDYPDLRNVQTLAFQRIVEFHDFLDNRIDGNKFWKVHRRPIWCRDIIIFEIEDQNLQGIPV